MSGTPRRSPSPSSSGRPHSPDRSPSHASSSTPVDELNPMFDCYPHGQRILGVPGFHGCGPSYSSDRPQSDVKRLPRDRSPTPVSLEGLNSMFTCYNPDEFIPGIFGNPGCGPSYSSGRPDTPVTRLPRDRSPTPVSLEDLRSMFGAHSDGKNILDVPEFTSSHSSEKPHSPVRCLPHSGRPTPVSLHESNSMFECYPHGRPHSHARSSHAKAFPIGTYIVPYSDSSQRFEFRRYVFPTGLRLRLKMEHTYVELPTDEQTVISTVSDEVVAIFEENTRILRGLYNISRTRVKFNMVSRKILPLNRTEVNKFPKVGRKFAEKQFVISPPGSQYLSRH